MKRAVLITGSIALWVLLCTSCYYATKLKDLEQLPKVEYEYTDLNGNKGTSEHCFKRNNVDVCKVGKKLIRVVKLEKFEYRR